MRQYDGGGSAGELDPELGMNDGLKAGIMINDHNAKGWSRSRMLTRDIKKGRRKVGDKSQKNETCTGLTDLSTIPAVLFQSLNSDSDHIVQVLSMAHNPQKATKLYTDDKFMGASID